VEVDLLGPHGGLVLVGHELVPYTRHSSVLHRLM
jgi:hypothetical protein